MDKVKKDISELIKEHIHSLNTEAEIILLFPQGKKIHEELQIFVFLPHKVSFSDEKQYLDSRYKVELESHQSVSIYIYYKENWHKQFKNTPVYQKVQSEGITL